MNEANEILWNKVHETAEKMNKLREEVYIAIPKGEFSIGALAQCLKPYYGKATDEEIKEHIEALRRGLKTGGERYDKEYEDFVEEGKRFDGKKQLREEMDKAFEDLSDAERWLMLDGWAEELCPEAKAKEMGMDELKDKVCEKMYEKYRGVTEESILEMKNARQIVGDVEFEKHEDSGFSEEERDLIDAAVAYTVMMDDNVIDSEQFGEVYAVQKRGWGDILMEGAINYVKAIVASLAVAAALFAMNCTILTMIAVGAATWLVYLTAIGYSLVLVGVMVAVCLANEYIKQMNTWTSGGTYAALEATIENENKAAKAKPQAVITDGGANLPNRVHNASEEEKSKKARYKY